MSRPKLLPWLGLGLFVSAQAICLYVLLGFAPRAASRYMDLSALGSDWTVPGSIQVFLNTSDFFRNSWYAWIPLLAVILVGAGWMTWKNHEKSWPGLLLIALATAELGIAVAMVVMTYQHLVSLA